MYDQGLTVIKYSYLFIKIIMHYSYSCYSRDEFGLQNYRKKYRCL